MSRLGKGIVKRYYAWQFTGVHPLLYADGAFTSQGMKGFCLGGIMRGATGGFLKRNFTAVVLAGILRPWLILNPKRFSKIILGCCILKKASKQSYQTTILSEPFGILSVGVHPSCRQTGIGRELMGRAEDFARKNKFKEMDLTVQPDNESAIYFYTKLGWKKRDMTAWTGGMYKRIE